MCFIERNEVERVAVTNPLLIFYADVSPKPPFALECPGQGISF